MRLALAVLLLTTVAPAQWQLQQSNTTADLRGIHALGKGVAWASGSKGTVLRTLDGGKTWMACALPPGGERLDFRAVQAIDAKTAFVMSSGKGDLSRLYKTIDGCKSWKLVFTNPDAEGFWDAVKVGGPPIHDLVEVVIAGDPVRGSFTLFDLQVPLSSSKRAELKPFPSLFCRDKVIEFQLPLPARTCVVETFRITEKSSAPQNRQAFPQHYESPVPRPGEALFAASNSSLAFGPGVWYSPNIAIVTGGPNGPRFLQLRSTPCAGQGCEEWVKTALPLASAESAGAFSLGWKGEDHWSGVVVGGDYLNPDQTSGTAAYSLEEGHRWKPAETSPHGYRSAVAYLAAAKTWITVGPNGTDVSTDDGRNWHPLNPTADESQHWNALSLPFVVGPHGRIGLLLPSALESRP